MEVAFRTCRLYVFSLFREAVRWFRMMGCETLPRLLLVNLGKSSCDLLLKSLVQNCWTLGFFLLVLCNITSRNPITSRNFILRRCTSGNARSLNSLCNNNIFVNPRVPKCAIMENACSKTFDKFEFTIWKFEIWNSEALKLCNFEALELWNFRTLKLWILKLWNFETLDNT